MEHGFFEFIFLRKRLAELSEIFDELNKVAEKIIENTIILKKENNEDAYDDNLFLIYKMHTLISETSDLITTQENYEMYEEIHRIFNDSFYEKQDIQMDEKFEKDLKYVHEKMKELIVKEGAIIIEREDKLLGIDNN